MPPIDPNPWRRLCTCRRPKADAGWVSVIGDEQKDRANDALSVVCALIEKESRVLVAQRSVHQSLPLFWEFPGGKVEAGESEAVALKREIKEELGVEIEVGDVLASTTHAYPAFTITLHPRLCRLISGEPFAHEHALIAWCTPDELPHLNWAPADIPVFREYLERKLPAPPTL